MEVVIYSGKEHAICRPTANVQSAETMSKFLNHSMPVSLTIKWGY